MGLEAVVKSFCFAISLFCKLVDTYNQTGQALKALIKSRLVP